MDIGSAFVNNLLNIITASNSLLVCLFRLELKPFMPGYPHKDTKGCIRSTFMMEISGN